MNYRYLNTEIIHGIVYPSLVVFFGVKRFTINEVKEEKIAHGICRDE